MLCCHEQAAFVFESAVNQELADVFLDFSRVGAGAVQRFGDFDVGVFVTFAADFVHGVELAEHFGIVCEVVSDDVDYFALFVVAFEDVAFSGVNVCVAVIEARKNFVIAVFCVTVELFVLAALGIFTLFVGHMPADFFCEESFEGNIHARVEILHGLAENHVGIAG